MDSDNKYTAQQSHYHCPIILQR